MEHTFSAPSGSSKVAQYEQDQARISFFSILRTYLGTAQFHGVRRRGRWLIEADLLKGRTEVLKRSVSSRIPDWPLIEQVELVLLSRSYDKTIKNINKLSQIIERCDALISKTRENEEIMVSIMSKCFAGEHPRRLASEEYCRWNQEERWNSVVDTPSGSQVIK